MALSTDGFPYTFPITWATGVHIDELGLGYDSISEATSETVAETGTGTDTILVQKLEEMVFNMDIDIKPKYLTNIKMIPKYLMDIKIIPKYLIDTEIRGG